MKHVKIKAYVFIGLLLFTTFANAKNRENDLSAIATKSAETGSLQNSMQQSGKITAEWVLQAMH